MGIKHAKVSAKADGGDTTKIRPSDWNEDHIGEVRTDTTIEYPTDFDGTDTFDAVDLHAAATNVDAFNTKEILGDVWHLRTVGTLQSDRVRVTLGTSRSGVFDIRVCLTPYLSRFNSNSDTFFDFRLSQSDDTQIALMRIHGFIGGVASAAYLDIRTKLGTGTPNAAGSEVNPQFHVGQPVWLRITRDGSNVLRGFWAPDRKPMAWLPIWNGGIAPATATVSGTLARVEFAVTHPNGDANHQSDIYIDFLQNL